MTTEIIIAVAALGAMVFMTGGGTALAFLYPKIRGARYEARFPVKVPGWGTKLERQPPFKATVEDIALMNECLVDAAVEKGLKRRDAKKKCDNLRVTWVRYDPSVETESGGRARLHIRDPWGRTGPNGEPFYVAGWHRGDEVHLVFRPELQLHEIEYDHEGTHELQELDDGDDHAHSNLRFWGNNGIEQLAWKMYVARKDARS